MKQEGRLVLVVDDEQILCNVIHRVLTTAGYRVLTAQDARSGLSIVELEHPDVIILDLMMPGMDGREMCSVVRQIAPASRVIYFTAKMEFNLTKLRELRQEADAFLRKPATSRQILNNVEKVLKISAPVRLDISPADQARVDWKNSRC